MQDSRFMRTLLFDYYGELLTDKQREYYDLHYNEDLSLFEIAEQSGVSRQAVWDIIRRAESALENTEAKLGHVARAVRRREKIAEALEAARRLADGLSGEDADKARRIAELLLEIED